MRSIFTRSIRYMSVSITTIFLYFLSCLFLPIVSRAQDTTTYEPISHGFWNVFLERNFKGDTNLRENILYKISKELDVYDHLLPDTLRYIFSDFNIYIHYKVDSSDRQGVALKLDSTARLKYALHIQNARIYDTSTHIADLALLPYFALLYQAIVLHYPTALNSAYMKAKISPRYHAEDSTESPVIHNEEAFFYHLSASYWNRGTVYPYTEEELIEFDSISHDIIELAWQHPDSLVKLDQQYDTGNIQGWTVHCNLYLHDSSYTADLLRRIDDQLASLKKVLPAKLLKQFQSIPIYIDRRDTLSPCPLIRYFSSDHAPDYFTPQDWNNSLVISSARRYLNYVTDYDFFLYELARAYCNNLDSTSRMHIQSVWEHAVLKGLYPTDNVADVHDSKKYFRFLTLAYMDKSDYFPKTRQELKDQDPDGYALMKEIWEK